MRAVVLTEPGTFDRQERERPTPAADEVLVEVTNVGICGSDLHYFEHGRIGDYIVTDPLVLGHESAGRVVEAGADVDLAPGTAVALEPGVPCRRCARCRRGDYHLCPDVTFMATPPDDGALVEYVAWPADYAHALPEGVSTREGALCEPLSVGIHATRRGGVGVGDTVLVAGCGPIGRCTMAAARTAGATGVLVSDVVDEKLERALEAGADRAVNVTDEDLLEAVAAETGGEGVDVVVEAAGSPRALRTGLEAARRGGTVVVVGLPSEREVSLDAHAIVDGELDVHGSFRYANAYAAAVGLLADGRVDLEALVDFESPLADVEAAFRRARDPEVVKGMIAIDDGSG